MAGGAGQDLIQVVVVRARVDRVGGEAAGKDDQTRERAEPECKPQPQGDSQPSLRTYPLPLSVWISLGSPSASSFWRSCLM